MSEKELRAELQGLLNSHYCESCRPKNCTCRQCHGIREILADEPDLDKVLRKIDYELENAFIGQEGASVLRTLRTFIQEITHE